MEENNKREFWIYYYYGIIFLLVFIFNVRASSIQNVLLTWILPLVVLAVLGNIVFFLVHRRDEKKAINLENDEADVKPYEGITFADVEGIDEAEDSLVEIVEYLHNPDKYKDIGASMPKRLRLQKISTF